MTENKQIWRENYGISNKTHMYHSIPKKINIVSYTKKEVSKHNTEKDCWIIINKRVYNITNFIQKHPGGQEILINAAGKDVTDAFENYHAGRIYKNMLKSYMIGELSDAKNYNYIDDFRNIRQTLLKANLFQTNYYFYYKLCTWLTLLFLTAITLSIYGENTITRMSGAAIMGIFWQQIAGLGHDLGHTSVTHDYNKDHLFGSMLTTLMGLSVCWWKSDHNTHHTVCNSIKDDPNIQHMPLLAVDSKIFQSPFWDTYHKKIVKMDHIAKFLVSYQHIFFYPLMLFARWNLYAQGILYLLLNNKPYRYLELCGISVFFTWMISLAYSMPTTAETLGWLFISHAVSGILNVQIVLSHWSRETYKKTLDGLEENEWHILQMRTTMNINTPEWFDFAHIGLQHQIEHHLFPRLPRHNLRKARTLVKQVCTKHNIHYHELGFIEANKEMWNALKDAAYQARKKDILDGGFCNSILYNGFNGIG